MGRARIAPAIGGSRKCSHERLHQRIRRRHGRRIHGVICICFDPCFRTGSAL